jgi:aryl-alcohol dehydrogenase-like predicted oxidoreductase
MTASIVSSFAKRLLGMTRCSGRSAFSSIALGFVCLASLWQLHRIDPKVPRDEQFGAIKTLLDLGVIRNVGLSEVSVPEIEAASSEAQMLEQCRHVGLIARDAVQSLREHNVEPATLGVLQQRLDTRPKNDTGTGDGGGMASSPDWASHRFDNLRRYQGTS